MGIAHRSVCIAYKSDICVSPDLAQKQQEILKQQLKEGAIQRSKRDLSLAEEYFHLEEEAWQKQSAIPNEAKSI